MATKQPSDPKSIERMRKAYVGGRIAALRDELKAMTEEKKELTDRLNAPDLGEAAQRKLKQRRMYVIQRPSFIRTELESLTKERDSLGKTSN